MVDPLSGAPGILGWAHLILFGFVIPLAAIRTGRWLRAADPEASRLAYYLSLLVQLWVFAAFSVWVAFVRGIDLSLFRLPSPGHAMAGMGLLAAIVVLMWPLWRRSARERDAVFRFFIPGSRPQRLVWILVSASAGIGEEITWRAVQYLLLVGLMGDPVPAVVVCSLMFGAAHMGQGVRGAILAAPFAAILHVVVIVSGSLVLAMALHFLYDAIAGLTLGRMGRRAGWR